MRWLDRLREKNRNAPPSALTKLTKEGGASAEETFVSFVRASLQDAELFRRPLEARPTRVIPPRDEVIRVAYQAIWYDYDLRDGVYTPEQLQRARKVVKRGPVRHYLLRWPGGRPAPGGGHCAMRV
jgi:hypothetical protein